MSQELNEDDLDQVAGGLIPAPDELFTKKFCNKY